MPLKSSISSHVRISYRLYEFVTTRYTTDFYIINQHIHICLMKNQLTSVTKNHKTKQKVKTDDSTILKRILLLVIKSSVRYFQETIWLGLFLLLVYCNCVHLHSFTCVQNIKQFFIFKTVDLELTQ